MRKFRRIAVTLAAVAAVGGVGAGAAQAATTGTQGDPLNTYISHLPSNDACIAAGDDITHDGREGSYLCYPDGEGTYTLEISWPN